MSLVMRDDVRKMDQDLLLELLGSPDQVYLVQDANTAGAGSLWFVVLEDAGNDDSNAGYLTGWRVRMFVNTFDDKWRVVVAQMTTLFKS